MAGLCDMQNEQTADSFLDATFLFEAGPESADWRCFIC